MFQDTRRQYIFHTERCFLNFRFEIFLLDVILFYYFIFCAPRVYFILMQFEFINVKICVIYIVSIIMHINLVVIYFLLGLKHEGNNIQLYNNYKGRLRIENTNSRLHRNYFQKKYHVNTTNLEDILKILVT